MIDYARLLEEYELWPMESWNHFDFVHQPPSDPAEEARQVDVLRSKVSSGVSGVYAYAKDGKWIYVGKGAPLFNRFKSHYLISYKELPGDTKDKRWHRFFSSNVGHLAIYWKQVEREPDRRIFELTLTELLEPAFERFR